MTGSVSHRPRKPTSPAHIDIPSQTSDSTFSQSRASPERIPKSPASSAQSSSNTSTPTSRAPPPPPSQQDESDTSEATSSEEVSADEGETPHLPTSSRSSHLPTAEDDERLRRLKEAVSQKMREQEQMGRPQARTTSSSMNARRFSPIHEEESSSTPTVSPSLEAAFASPPPLPSVQTASTESTESVKTIRGSAMPTPSVPPLRTPSYPFPYIPGTPRAWTSGAHRPFTTLSPTSIRMNICDHTPGDKSVSEMSTPAANAFSFLPSGVSSPATLDDDEHPYPNLYELSLELNLEPGMHSWWKAVTRILHANYTAARASLTVPADAGDLENVPWAQIATYNEAGSPIINPYASAEAAHYGGGKDSDGTASTPGAQRSGEEHGARSNPLRTTGSNASTRPNLLSRHSYAGFEKEKSDFITPTPTPSATSAERPRLPSRTKSYAPQALKFDATVKPTFSLPPGHGTPSTIATSDLEFSSINTEPLLEPYVAVLPKVQGLNHEYHALINSTHVNRIISQGRIVTLRREFATAAPATPAVITPSHSMPATPSNKDRQEILPLAKKAADTLETARAKMKLSAEHFPTEPMLAPYEEFEQFPSSPWSQSPAPSPAIQADPEENPFFASQNVDETAFDSSDATPEFTKLQKVEAIGIDRAETVVHIPLIHPTLSQILLSRNKPKNKTKEHQQEGDEEEKLSIKKAPIAILSFLSPVVPYPEHLLRSLGLLSPHLAISLGQAQQYSDAQRQASAMLVQNRGHRVGFAPFAADREGLQQLMDADSEVPASSITESVTSQSDWSGRSRASPGGSLMGTPGWDTSSIMGRLSSTNTPALVSEASDSYFDAHEHLSIPNNTSAKDLRTSADEPRTAARGSTKDDSKRRRTTSLDDRQIGDVPRRQPIRRQSGRGGSMSIADKGDRKPQYLHSYGADLSITVPIMPMTATLPSDLPTTPPLTGASYDHVLPPPSERLLRIITDTLPVQIFTAAPDTGNLTWFNAKFLAFRGKDIAAIKADSWGAVHPDDKAVYMEKWQQSLSTGQNFASKVRLQRFDKAYRYFFVRASPLKDKRQNIVHWTGTMMDVHDQHLAEQAAAKQAEIAASEKKHRAMANSSPQITFTVRREQGLIYCNAQWLTYSGQKEDQAMGAGFFEHVHPDDLHKCRLPILNDDGTVADVPLTLPVKIHRSDTAMSTSEESNAGNSSGSGSSSDGRTVTSPGARPSSDWPQVKLSKLASQGIIKVAKDPDGRPTYSTEVRLRNKEGEYHWHLVKVVREESVTTSSHEEEETWYGTCTDINDHKLLEQTLKEAMDAKTRFLSNMSHEIRTPLNGIMGMVLFLLDTALSPEQLEHVNIIRTSTEGLRDLINDILDLAKVEAGMITLQPSWFHLRTLVEEINDLQSATTINKGLELNYFIDDDVPSSIKGDRFRLRQVLINTIGNAAKFTSEGEVFVKVERYDVEHEELAENETFLKFSIIDTGSGFTEKDKKFLFKRFSQVDSSSTKQHGGTGLGLAISKQLVQLHGGDMDATSEPGKGAQFFFYAKFQVPTEEDHPLTAVGTPGFASAAATPGFAAPRRPSTILPPHWSPQLSRQDSDSSAISAFTQSPVRHESATSSGSSDPTLASHRTSMTSTRSSVSSLHSAHAPPMTLALPTRLNSREHSDDSTPGSVGSEGTVHARSDSSAAVSPTERKASPTPQIFSILVICPLKYSRQAIVRHIETTIPQGSPHHITAPEDLTECQKLLGMTGDSHPVNFTHVVMISHEASDISLFAGHILKTPAYSSTLLVVISDFTQRKAIESQLRGVDLKKREELRKLRWITRPLKPSKFSVVFDPKKLRELSTDHNQDSAQAVVLSQKQIFDETRRRLGNKGIRVLLVEDNKTNQMVLQKFLGKVDIYVDTVVDGQECSDAIFGNDRGYYSIILCDLHMPNKDGYQTCREIRRWERKSKFDPMPIIALSANVLGDVYQQCADAGFNSYVTKPVDFKVLSHVLLKYLDPEHPEKPIEFMKRRK